MELPVNYDKTHYTKRRAVREEYIRIQNGLCYHCEHPLRDAPADYINAKPVEPKLFPKGFFDNPVHLHHNHDTGMTIGAVHSYCNAVLWQYHGK